MPSEKSYKNATITPGYNAAAVPHDRDVNLLMQYIEQKLKDDALQFQEYYVLPTTRALLEENSQLDNHDISGLINTILHSVNGLIKFDQNTIVDKLPELHMETLVRFNNKFNGLCELVCNLVIMEDLLGKIDDIQMNDIERVGKNFKINYFAREITPDRINDAKIKESHILNVTSVITKIIAFLFDIYPCSIMNFAEQGQLTTKDERNNLIVRQDILRPKLDKMRINTYLKFEVFTKSYFSFSGHSMLIKKTSANEYSFFDPSKGEYAKIDFTMLEKLINDAIFEHGATSVAFLDAESFCKRYIQPNPEKPSMHRVMKP